MSLQKFSVKDPTEILQYSFDFSLVIPSSTELISSSIWTIYLQSDANATNIPTMLVGGGSEQILGKLCSNYVKNGTSGATYVLCCTVVTSAGESVKIAGILPVRTFR